MAEKSGRDGFVFEDECKDETEVFTIDDTVFLSVSERFTENATEQRCCQAALTPTTARAIAAALIKCADEAEGGSDNG